MVGLANPTHVACHISTAIWIVYSIDPLREAIIRVGLSTRASAVTLLFSRVLRGLQRSDDVVDPSALYRQLRYEGVVDSTRPGDAVTSLTKLLSFLRLDPILAPLMEQWLYSGQTHSVLRATAGDRSLTKTLKTKPVPCPWTFPCDVSESAKEVLVASLCHTSEQPVSGYVWKLSADDDGGESWITTKRICVDSLPPTIMIHIEGRKDSSTRVIFPDFLEGSSICPVNHDQYALTSAIVLLLSDDDDEVEESEEQHVVALCRMADNAWCLMDDESSRTLPATKVHELLRGTESSELGRGEGTSRAVGLLACYQKELSEPATQPVEELQMVNWNDPESFIGRRLRIQWGKNKWYTGTITAYCEDDLHEVTYDDGDIRRYNLIDKVLEWEASDDLIA